MTSPSQQLADAAKAVLAGQLTQQQHAKDVAAQIAAERAAAQATPAAGTTAAGTP